MCKVTNRRHVSHSPATYIGRGSKWGNPFKIGVDGTRDDVIARHAEWLKSQISLLKSLDEMKGKDLECYCAPLACHGDLLLKLANSSREERILWWRGASSVFS